jgi:hypothetical protein
MQHDFSIVFETDNPYWQRVLDIFEKNEKFEKKIVKNRNLHHKFPRSFSKILGEPVDNDKDNLISLSLADHFLVHYYYYLLAKKGYRQSMATAFTFMAKKGLKYTTPDTAEAMAKDYADAVAIANQAQSDRMKGNDFFKGHTLSKEARKLISDNHADVSGSNNPMWGKHQSEECKRKISVANKGRKFSEDTRRMWSESRKGRKLSEETKAKIAAARKAYWEAKKRGEMV